MKDQQKNIAVSESTDHNNSSELKRLVSLPAIQINEITFGDSLELTGCVPAKADLILEDMPYNTTACDWDKEPIDLKRYWESRMELIKPTGVICLTTSQPFTTKIIVSNMPLFKEEIIWLKNKSGAGFLADKRHIKTHENILVFASGSDYTYNPQKWAVEEKEFLTQRKTFKEVEVGNTIYTKMNRVRKVDTGMRNPFSVIAFRVPFNPAKTKSYKYNIDYRVHPTQKPVGLFEYLIRTYTNEGELVFDGFGGSGTTAIAAHRTKRNFIVIEKDKRYFEIASKRLYQERNPLSTFDEAS